MLREEMMFSKMIGSRKWWLLTVAAAAVFAGGLAGGAALAANDPAHGGESVLRQGSGPEPASHGQENIDAVMARVAEIIGVEPEELEDAFRTARDEQAEVRFNDRIDELMADKTLSEEQGDEAKAWFARRPAKTGPVAIILAITADAERVERMLARMVEADVVTQPEADALAEWHTDRPAFLPEPSRRDRRGHDE